MRHHHFAPDGPGPARVGTPFGIGYVAGMNKPSPVEPDFATPEEAAAYDAWFRAKVEASLADGRPGVPHDEVMAELRAIIEAKRRPKAC